MTRKFVLALLLSGVSSPVLAAQGENDSHWRVGISGGTTLVGQGDDQAYVSASVTREIGDGYIQLSATKVDAGDVQGFINAVPASTEQLSLSAGIGLGAVSLDGDVTIGRRKFDSELIGNDGNPVIVDSDGRIFGIGAAITYDLPVGDNGFLSPSLSIDYNSVDIGRVATLVSGRQATIEEREEGVGVSLGVSYVHLFGEDGAHSFGPFAALVASSNSTAFAPGNTIGGQRMARVVAFRNVPGEGDVWGEFGASASFGLGGSLRLSLNASQSLGFDGPESTSLGAGVSFSF
ncbi:MAG: hypothetical protein V3V15_10045 [Sphingorhabdus sp.]